VIENEPEAHKTDLRVELTRLGDVGFALKPRVHQTHIHEKLVKDCALNVLNCT
jgi:hypothetical protein